MKNYYRVKGSINSLNVKVNDIIVEDVENKEIYLMGATFDADCSFLNLTNKSYFENITAKVNDFAKSKYNVNDYVKIINEKNKNVTYVIREVKYNISYDYRGNIENKYTYILVDSCGNTKESSTKYLKKINVYYFINSKGRLCLSDKDDPETELWRRMIGNYFETRKEAEDFVDNVWRENLGDPKVTLMQMYSYNKMIKMFENGEKIRV